MANNKDKFMTRRVDEEKLNKMNQNQRGGGPARRFGNAQEKPKNARQTIKRLFKYISSSRILFAILIIIVIVYSVLGFLLNVVTKNTATALGEYNFKTNTWGVLNENTGLIERLPDHEAFKFWFIAGIIIILSYCILQFFVSYLGAQISIRMTKKMRKDLFKKIVYLPIKYTDTHPHGDIMSRFTNDVDNVTNAVSQTISSLISGILTLVGCLVLMVYYSPLLLVVSLVSLLLTVLFTLFMSKFMRPLYREQQKVLGLLNSQAEENITGCKTVIAYNHQEIAEDEFNYYSEKLRKTAIKANILGGSMGPVMNFIGNVGFFLICIFGAIFISKGIGGSINGEPLTIAVVIVYLNLARQFTRPINEIAQLYSQILNALAGGERVFNVLDEQVEDFSKKVDFDYQNTKGYIEFEHVNFSYVEGKPVLKDFTVDVRSGHEVALVGATGSGKTTIVNLLLRFYDVDSGTIKIDGINIADMSKKELREAICIVLQDSVLFGDTIEKNVKYGRPDATQEEYENALKMAHCYSFVNRLPDKDQTVLSEGATNISQGQRQLLTIARAILADPKILILDEATSSVDTRTEKKIQDAMVNLMKNRTSIIIAHRLSTIQDADFIVVLDQGHVVEMGNHQELLDLGGIYNKLYMTQFSGLNT